MEMIPPPFLAANKFCVPDGPVLSATMDVVLGAHAAWHPFLPPNFVFGKAPSVLVVKCNIQYLLSTFHCTLWIC